MSKLVLIAVAALSTLVSHSSYGSEALRSIQCLVKKGFINPGEEISFFQVSPNQNLGMGVGGADYLELGKIVGGIRLEKTEASNWSGPFATSYVSPQVEDLKVTVLHEMSWSRTIRRNRFDIRVIISGPMATLLGSNHLYLEARCRKLREGFYAESGSQI